MKYNPYIHHRRSIRLKGYDYSQPGAYFITICTQNRECLFGKVVDGEMRLNPYGIVVRREWFRSADIRRELELYDDEFVVMPNHIHGIVWLVETAEMMGGDETVGAHGRAPLQRASICTSHGDESHSGHTLHRPPRSLSSFVAGFKSAVTKHINQMRNTPGAPVWQRNYYEQIVRDENELNRIRKYIVDNPLKWALDRENPTVGTDLCVRPEDEPWRI